MLFLGSLFFAGALEATEWAKTYGGAGADSLSSMQPTADGGYIVAGSTTSFGAGGSDAWLMKLAADGSIVWQKTYGGTESDGARSRLLRRWMVDSSWPEQPNRSVQEAMTFGC